MTQNKLNKLNGQLIKAAEHGDTKRVRELLDSGAEINAKDINGENALMKASAAGWAETVKLLLDAGADIDIQDKFGRTALMPAAANGRADTVKLLLDAGADIDRPSKYGWTALMMAAACGHTGVMELLIQAGKDSDGQSVLHWACENENLNCIKLLLDMGADICASNEHKDTPLHYAARNSFSQAGAVLLLLKAGANVNELNTDGQTALHYAAQKGNIFCMQVLLDHGCDPEKRDIDGKTADDILRDKNLSLFQKYKNIKRLKLEDLPEDYRNTPDFDI